MIDNGFVPPKREMHPSPVFTDDVLRNILDTEPVLNRELLHNAALTGSVALDLGACLAGYAKGHLQDLAQDHELRIPSSSRKHAYVEALQERIAEQFPRMLPYLPTVNLEFLARFSHEEPTLRVHGDSLRFRDISHAHNFGFLYLFRDGEHFTAVVPRELLPSLRALSDSKTWERASLHQRMDAYAVSLSNLYGVLDIDQFAIMWNRFESERLTPAMAQDELHELGKIQYYWWFDDELVISSFFQSSEEVEQFMEKVKQVSYYTPTREELLTYFQTPYDDDSPAVSAMMEFLSGYRLPNGEQIEDLMDDITDACIVGDGMQDVFDLLNEYGLLFSGMDEINRFTELYVQMSDHSRKWELRGHTPIALRNMRDPH
jgi:hypothetical protein